MDFWVLNSIILWVAVLLNLLLTVGLIRRVNTMGSGGGGVAGLPPGLPAGTPVPDATVTALDGTEVALTDLTRGPSALLFLTTTCEGCRDQLPAVRTVLAGASGIGVVALIATTDPADAGTYRDELPGATVVMAAGTTSDALARLQVHTFPMYYTVDGQGRIADTAFTPTALEGALASLGAGAGRP